MRLWAVQTYFHEIFQSLPKFKLDFVNEIFQNFIILFNIFYLFYTIWTKFKQIIKHYKCSELTLISFYMLIKINSEIKMNFFS